MHHLTLRVAWHDNKWNGTVCEGPSNNPYCLALDRIRAERNDESEDAVAGEYWSDLPTEKLPPCIAEGGGFMNEKQWTRVFNHPYQEIDKAAATHGVLKPTPKVLPPFSALAVPFAWMLKENQQGIQESCPQQLPADEESPFATPWVFGRDRQEAVLDLVFGRLADEKSLAFFYCKEGQPLGDLHTRLVVGVGRILKVGKLLRYDSKGAKTYPLWDRIIQHSIRPDSDDGLLLPYHEYTEPTGDAEEDARRLELLKEIAVPVTGTHVRTFSYGAELAQPDVALSVLVRCLESVRRVREHGIAKGPWAAREEWLNAQIAAAWKDRGAFPGAGSALEALGMRLGTSLVLELLSGKSIGPTDDPWPTLDKIIRGKQKPPQKAYQDDIAAIRKTWEGLSDKRRTLLFLLSRFSLSPDQAIRWFNEKDRTGSTKEPVSDQEIIDNPYRICETDMGDGSDPPISIDTIDRGLLPDDSIRTKHPVPAPSGIGSPNDPRRLRASMVSVLRDAEGTGDTLLSPTEVSERVEKLKLNPACSIPPDWLAAHAADIEPVIDILDILKDPERGLRVSALQLKYLKAQEDKLRKLVVARVAAVLPSLSENWRDLISKAIKEAGGTVDPKIARHKAALAEQAEALERVTTRKLSVLVGRAGTGKSSVVGALTQSRKLTQDGILLLAPTGKARVRLGKATKAEAKTVAQFLYDLERYDPKYQKPKLTGKTKYAGPEKTVVIDESSMLTMDSLLAVLEALDLVTVKRIILVGDPNQLPPIGAGRPFADLVAMLDEAADSTDPTTAKLASARGRLTVEVRTVANTQSDALRLASWFTREPQPVDADRVISELRLNHTFNDLEVCFWKKPDDLKQALLQQFKKHLKVNSAKDIGYFNLAVGLDKSGLVPEFDASGAEAFQVLSPVRMRAFGIYELNRWIQRTFRAKELEQSRQVWGLSLGDEEIVTRDKVIQLKNQKRKAYNGTESEDVYLANGEIGIVCGGKYPYRNVVFAGRPGLSVGYRKQEFPRGSGPLELAYCLTVHKGQGSEFDTVFFILPDSCFNLSRELLYTALTRSRVRMVLLIQGTDANSLFDWSKPEKSETARRNTNLFAAVVRDRMESTPHADNLIHRTEKGHMVRSKSELVIANMLFRMKMEYEYERPLEGTTDKHILHPDFTFATAAGEPILWEHLGMLSRPDYKAGWEWKLKWYRSNGFVLGENLFTTEDDEKGGLDSKAISATADAIKKLL